MTQPAIDALASEIAHARELIATLTPDEWAAPSACTDWTVQDVVCHMASAFHALTEPSTIEGGTSHDAEQNAEVPVRARRSWTAAQVAEDYEEWSVKGLAGLTAFQSPGLADRLLTLGNLGSHPMHLLANAIVFDHYCHLRHDIGKSVPRAAGLPHDPASLSTSLEWMLAGLPQMCAPALAECTPDQGINIVFEGPAAGEWTLTPGTPLWSVEPGRNDTWPTVAGTAHDFVAWSTKRTDWRTHTQVDDFSRAAPILDAINII